MSRLSTKTIETIKCEIKATFSSLLTMVLKTEKAEAQHGTRRSNNQIMVKWSNLQGKNRGINKQFKYQFDL